MLPVLIRIGGDAGSAWLVYLLGVLLVAYAAWSGWRSAKGSLDKKRGGLQAPTREQRIQNAAVWGVAGAIAAGFGFHYALPDSMPLGGKGAGIPVHTYGLMLAGGFMGAVALAAELARREWRGALGEKRRDQVFDIAFWVFIGGVGGAKLLFILVGWKDFAANWSAYLSNPLKLIDCLSGGLVFYGGLIGAAVAVYLYTRRTGMEFLRFTDLAFPTVSFGQALGRLGCFAAGCCWGHPTGASTPLAVTFPGAAGAEPLVGSPGAASLAFADQVRDGRYVDLATGSIFETAREGAVRMSDWVSQNGHTLPVHPTQLYEAVGQLGIFALLLFLRAHRRFTGMISGLWLVLYAVLRSGVELLRGDEARGTLHGLLASLFGESAAARVPLEAWYNISTSQFISLCIFAMGVVLLVRQSRNVRPPQGESASPGAPSPA